MRLFLFTLLLAGLLGSRAAYAQAPGSLGPAALPAAPSPPASPAVAAAPSVAGSDTAAALHYYYARRRHNGHVSLGVGGGLVAAGILTAVIGGQQGSWSGLGYVVLGAGGAIISLPLAVRGIILNTKYSEAQEQRTIRDWQQRRLPNRLARRALNPALTWDESLR